MLELNAFNSIAIVETICYNELITGGGKACAGKAYRGQVDFIARRGREKMYVQAARYLTDEAVTERECGTYRLIGDAVSGFQDPRHCFSMKKIKFFCHTDRNLPSNHIYPIHPKGIPQRMPLRGGRT